MTDYNVARRFIKARNEALIGSLKDRNKTILGIFVHSTRSGHSGGDDGPGTENWFGNPANTIGMADFIIFENGQQVKVLNWERDEQPLWAGGYGDYPGTWNAQQFYIHVELAQGVISDPFTGEQVESFCQFAAELARKYRFDVVRIPFLTQRDGTVPPEGLCDHEHSANGVKLGKSDPGYMFPWDRVIARTNEILKGDDELSAEDKALLAKLVRVAFGTEAVMDDLEKRQIAPLATRMNTAETQGDTSARKDVANLKSVIDAHIANHAAQAGGPPKGEYTATVRFG